MGEVYPNHVTFFPEEISPAHCALVPAEPDVDACESVGLYVPAIPKRRFSMESLPGKEGF